MDSQELHISKLDAARRQLDTAVRLYFSEADPVSIHTLAAASYQLIVDVNKACGGGASPMLVDSQYVKPEMRDYILDKPKGF